MVVMVLFMPLIFIIFFCRTSLNSSRQEVETIETMSYSPATSYISSRLSSFERLAMTLSFSEGSTNMLTDARNSAQTNPSHSPVRMLICNFVFPYSFWLSYAPQLYKGNYDLFIIFNKFWTNLHKKVQILKIRKVMKHKILDN